MKKLFLNLLIVFGMTTHCFAANNATDVYLLAQTKNATELGKLENIDVVDSNGDTALCSAIKFNDVDSYNALKSAGANTEHKCVKKIPTEQYKSFTQKLATANKSWSFLGMGKWAWGAIGLGVAGGAVAAGMGGGGSGGGTQGDQYVPDPESLLSCQERGFTYSQSDTCPEGWEKDSAVCLDGEVFWYKCNTPHTCPSSYFTECTGAWQDMPGANTCLSGTTIYKECQPVSCDGYVTYCDVGYTAIIGDTCQSGNDTLVKCQPNACDGYVASCGAGYTEVYGDVCSSGETTLVKCEPNACEGFVPSCDTGYIESGAVCQSGENTLVQCEFDDENYIEQGGVIYPKLNCVHGNQVANSCSCGSGWVGELCDSPVACGENYRTECTGGWEPTSNTCLSGGTVYYECQQVQCSTNQIWSESGCVNCGNNAYVDGNQCQCNPGYAAWVAETGCVEISNCGSHAYKQGLNCICEPGYANWEYGIGCLPQDGAITINNTADDNVVGKTGTNANGIINIHNTNDNNTVYGAYNQYNSNYNSNGTIYIQNTGDSNVYGIYSGLVDGYSGNFIDRGFYDWDNPQNLVTSSNITVINHGDGDVYGAYRHGISHYSSDPDYFNANLMIEAGDTPYNYVNTQATIDLTNVVAGESGSGNLYGLWGLNLYNSYADREDFYTDTTSFALGKINITNGDGNAYGMYVENGSSSNAIGGTNAYHADGEITIFNIGSGNAYGMYGPNITNLDISESTDRNGIINLINYDAGNIFGMYGSNISNENASSGDGESIINLQNLGSGQAVGICGGNNLGLNSGTININNVGTGTAIGASGGMTNNGIINITRESYTDEGGWIYMPETSNYIQDPYDPENYILETIPAHMEYASDYIYNPTGTSGSVFGMYNGLGSIYNTGTLNISSNGDAYGMYSEDAYNITNSGNINITSYGNIYGIYTKHTAFTINNSSDMILNNLGNGNVYGVYSAANNLGESHYGNINGILNITNSGAGDAYGMYIEGAPISNFASNNLGNISILNEGTGKAYGMYGRYISNNNGGAISIVNDSNNTVYGMLGYSVTNNGSVNIQNLSNGDAIGLFSSINVLNYGSESSASNAGGIIINNIGEGTAIGILGDTNTNITNSMNITITRNAYVDENDITHNPTINAGTVYGIYAKPGSTVNNSGTIIISSTGQMYGIYAEGNATVVNTGAISFNNDAQWCSGSGAHHCDGSSSYGALIVLNGSNLLNSGVMQMQSLNLNATGGNVVAGLGAQFIIENELSGDLNISSELVQNGNQTTYIAENMIDAGDVSGLNVRSASAMFNASLADNGHDVVMQMKDFNELTDNASLAAFLKNNYTNGNGAELFGTLKSIDNMSAFNNTLSGLTGLNTFTQFAHEDLSAMREISFSMNNKLFENSGRDSFDISDSTGYFSFSNDHNGGSGRYGISNDKISDNWKLGYGMAMANINTGDGDSMHRQNNLWLFYMPATYTNNDIELVIAPKAGFAHSEYNRRGYNNINYEGYIEKRIFGLMNDLRYPLTFGNWTFAPDLAFNAIVYDQSGHEDEQAFSLVIPDDRTVSVETGLGFYTKYEKQLSDGSRFKLNSGLMVYREFGDTDDIKLGMRGMDGTFSLYNNDYEYRGAASLGFDYTAGHLHLYGNAQYFMDNDNYMNFKGGISYRF